MALKGRGIDKFVKLLCLVASGGLEISSTSFQKSNIGWPQQPLTERVSNISKNWIFDDPFHKNEPALVILVPGTIESSSSGSSLIK